MMKIIKCDQRSRSNEHFVLDVDESGILLESNFSIEDIIINSPYGDVDLAFHPELVDCVEFPDNECLRIPGKPDVKEITRVMCTRVALKSPKGTIRCWITLQRN